jgi:hypothetical protein
MNEQVRPHLKLIDRKDIPTTPGLQISDDISDDDEEINSSRSRSSSRTRPSVNNSAPQISHPHNMSSGSGQYSLSTSPNHVLTSTFPTQVPPPANPSISPTITVSSARDTSSTHAIHSLRSTSSSSHSSFTNTYSWVFPSPGSSSSQRAMVAPGPCILTHLAQWHSHSWASYGCPSAWLPHVCFFFNYLFLLREIVRSAQATH